MWVAVKKCPLLRFSSDKPTGAVPSRQEAGGNCVKPKVKVNHLIITKIASKVP